jgi:hypothetical protein
MTRRSKADFDSVRRGIAKDLRARYSGVLSEAIPEGMAESLRLLDQLIENDAGAAAGCAVRAAR